MCIFSKPKIEAPPPAPAPQAPTASPLIESALDNKLSTLVGTDGTVTRKSGLTSLRVDRVGTGLNIPTV